MAKSVEDIKEEIEDLFQTQTGFELDFTHQILVKCIAEAMHNQEVYFENLMFNSTDPTLEITEDKDTITKRFRDICIPKY